MEIREKRFAPAEDDAASCDLFERTRGIALPPRKGRGWASDRQATGRTRGTWPIGASVQARMTSAVRDAPL